MKKKFLKPMVAAALAASMTLSLCACGKTVGDGDGNSKSSKESKEEKTEYTLSECFKKEGTNIWYQIELEEVGVIGKDTLIRKVFVFEDGSLTQYDLSDLAYGDRFLFKLGDVAKMSDEEIIVELENYHQERLQERQQKLDKDIALAEDVLAQGYFDHPFAEGVGTEESGLIDVTKNKGEYEKYLSELKSQYDLVYEVKEAECCEFAIYTDSTGNRTDYEVLKYEYTDAFSPNNFFGFYYHSDHTIGNNIRYLSGRGEEGLKFERKYDQVIDGIEYRYVLTLMETIEYSSGIGRTSTETLRFTDTVNGGIQIYDSCYGGYSCYQNKVNAPNYVVFITRLEDEITFKLDDVGAEGVEVDPE